MNSSGVSGLQFLSQSNKVYPAPRQMLSIPMNNHLVLSSVFGNSGHRGAFEKYSAGELSPENVLK